jgi:hypothetical protein
VRPRLGLPAVVVLIGAPLEVEAARPTIHAARTLTAALRAAVEDLRAPFGQPGGHVAVDDPLLERRWADLRAR